MTELFVGILAIGLWPWLVIICAAIVVTVLVEINNGTWATITLLGTIVLLSFGFKLGIFRSVVSNPSRTIVCAVAYFVIGAVWGLFKWYLFVRKRLREYQVAKAQFLESENASTLTPDLATKFSGLIWNYYNASATPPLASEYKAAIIRWMAYWPFSILGAVLNDVVRNLWRHIYSYMANTYDRIAGHVFRDVRADVEMMKQGKKER